MELEKAKTNIRGTWKVLNKILNRNRDSTTKKLEMLYDGNNILNTHRDIANGFNKYFVEVGPNLK